MVANHGYEFVSPSCFGDVHDDDWDPLIILASTV